MVENVVTEPNLMVLLKNSLKVAVTSMISYSWGGHLGV